MANSALKFDIQYMTQKSVKGSAIADHLAENPLDDAQPVTSEFPDGDIMVIEEEEANKKDIWKMYFDGAINVNGNGIRAVIVSPNGKQYPVAVKLDSIVQIILLNTRHVLRDCKSP